MRFNDPRVRAIIAMQKDVSQDDYYDALRALTNRELRRLWLAEGRRRGYEVN